MAATNSSLLAAAAAGIDDGDILLEAGECPAGDAHSVLLSCSGPPVDEAAANISAVSVPCRANYRDCSACESFSERTMVQELQCESNSARSTVREPQ